MALEVCEGSASRSSRSLPPGNTRYPLYGRLGGLQGQSGEMRKTPLPPEFDPRTVQLVASRYTNYATRPTLGGGKERHVLSFQHSPARPSHIKDNLKLNSSLMIQFVPSSKTSQLSLCMGK
jgi:hypothetical protein